MEKFINKIIQYEENIFYLKLQLNNIKRSHLLNINRELFHKKIKDDLIFIDKTVQILYHHLLKNDKLITKDEQLHSIMNLKTLFLKECNTLISSSSIKESDFIVLMDTNKKDIDYINEILSVFVSELNREDLTTNEELNILFMEDTLENEE